MATEKRNIEANTLREEISSLRLTVIGLRAGKGVLNEYMKQYRESVLRIIDEQPTVDAVEVVHGRWEKEYDSNGVDRGWKCSHCKRSVYQMTFEPYEYCPNCGAKKDGDGNET